MATGIKRMYADFTGVDFLDSFINLAISYGSVKL